MSHLTITRTTKRPDCPQAVFGEMDIDGQPFCVTLENADKLTPVGIYELVPHDSPKHPNTLAFVNPDLHVYHQPGDAPPGTEGAIRTDVLIHPANFADQLEGCCAVGESVARFPQEGMGITNSRRTMHTLLEVLGTRSGHMAEIKEDYA